MSAMKKQKHRLVVEISFNKKLTAKEAKGFLHDVLETNLNKGSLQSFGWVGWNQIRGVKATVKQDIHFKPSHRLSALRY